LLRRKSNESVYTSYPGLLFLQAQHAMFQARAVILTRSHQRGKMACLSLKVVSDSRIKEEDFIQTPFLGLEQISFTSVLY
jgi:hypothetical protein